MNRFQYQKTPDDEPSDGISAGEFWPAISLNDFQVSRRIPPEYDRTQQRTCLIRAIAMVSVELADWRDRQIVSGKESASECGQMIDGVGTAAALFTAAVYDQAKASLLIHFKTVNRRDEANNLAKEERSTYDELLREVQQSIRAILGISSATVMLL